MRKSYSEEDLRELLAGGRIESSVIEDRIEETLTRIREEETVRNNASKCRRRRSGRNQAGSHNSSQIKMIRCTGAAAAALLLAFGLCAANPSLAAEIPVIGSIFEKVWNVFSYGRMPEEETVELGESTDQSPLEADTEGYAEEEQEIVKAQDAGFTITLTQYYATDQAIYVGVRVESKEELPELAPMGDTGYQLMQMHAKEKFSFRDDVISNVWPVEGIQEDAHTFIGIMRMDYEQIKMDGRRYDKAVEEAERKGEPVPEITAETYDYWYDEIEIPDTFEVDMEIYRIWSYSRELTGKYEKAGQWNFSLKIAQSEKGMHTIPVDEVNGQGIGVDHIELTPVELAVYTKEPAEGFYYTVALDRDGLALPQGNSYRNGGDLVKNEMMIGGHDISVITVYICDYDAYMELDKTLITPGEYRDELERLAFFQKEIQIPY